MACLLAGFALLALAAPAAAAPGFTDSFPVNPEMFQVAMGPDGTTVYSGNPSVGPGSYRSAVQVRPPGGPVGDVQYLSLAGATGTTTPVVAAGPDGRLVAAWIESGVLQTAAMMPGTTTFTDPVSMPSTGDAPSGGIQVAVDQAGNASILWTGIVSTGTGPQFYLHLGTRPPSGGVSMPVLLDSTPTSSPSSMYMMYPSGLAVSAAGDAIAGWMVSNSSGPGGDTTNTVKAALRQAGGAFGSPITLDTGVDNGTPGAVRLQPPSVAMNASGDAAVTWENYNSFGGTPQREARFRIGSAAAGLGATVENAAASGGSMPSSPRLALAPDGRAAVLFVASVSGTQRAQVAFRPPGGPFGLTQTLLTTDPAEYATLAGGPNGELLAGVTTYNTTTGKNAIAGAAAAPGQFLDPPKTLISDVSSASVPAAGLGADGDGVVFWRALPPSGPLAYDARAAGWDVSGPKLDGLQIPGTGTAGTPVAFSVAPVDIWSAVSSVAWTFGDGGTAPDAAASHTYADAGDRTVGVTATDALGNSSSASGPISVGAAPVSPPPAAKDTTKPAVTGFVSTNRTFTVGPNATALVARKKKLPRGTTFRYTLSETASVAIAISRELPGLRRARGKPCLVATVKLRRALVKKLGARKVKRLACTALKKAGTLRRAGAAGKNAVAFSGRLERRALAPGRYRAALVATDAAGNASAAAIARFRIVKR